MCCWYRETKSNRRIQISPNIPELGSSAKPTSNHHTYEARTWHGRWAVLAFWDQLGIHRDLRGSAENVKRDSRLLAMVWRYKAFLTREYDDAAKQYRIRPGKRKREMLLIWSNHEWGSVEGTSAFSGQGPAILISSPHVYAQDEYDDNEREINGALFLGYLCCLPEKKKSGVSKDIDHLVIIKTKNVLEIGKTEPQMISYTGKRALDTYSFIFLNQ